MARVARANVIGKVIVGRANVDYGPAPAPGGNATAPTAASARQTNYATDAMAEAIEKQGIGVTPRAPAGPRPGRELPCSAMTPRPAPSLSRRPTRSTPTRTPTTGFYYTIHIQITEFDYTTQAIRKFADR